MRPQVPGGALIFLRHVVRVGSCALPQQCLRDQRDSAEVMRGAFHVALLQDPGRQREADAGVHAKTERQTVGRHAAR